VSAANEMPTLLYCDACGELATYELPPFEEFSTAHVCDEHSSEDVAGRVELEQAEAARAIKVVFL